MPTLKPSNVMVGRYGEVMLMDWGLAKVQRPSGVTSESPFATQEGTVLGTPAYMPPEQALGNNAQVDARSDIYSATVLFHELLSGRHYLSHCKTQKQMLSAILTETFPYMSLVFLRHPTQPVPPAELLHFMVQGLVKDPDHRYQSVDEMIERLARIRDGRCPVDCPATLAKRMLDVVARFIHHYPKLSPFLFYPAVALLLISVAFSLRALWFWVMAR